MLTMLMKVLEILFKTISVPVGFDFKFGNLSSVSVID